MRLQRLLLERELQAWRKAGETARLWWRDDDAREETPQLRRLLALAEERSVELTLAVAPGEGLSGLSACLRTGAPVTVVQKGRCATTRAPGEGEVPRRWGCSRVSAKMRQGWSLMADLTGALQVFVSTRGDVDPDLPRALEDGGYLGWSDWGAVGQGGAPFRVDAHLDVMKWTGGARFRGEARFLRDLRFALETRRGRADWSAPIGLLTHHVAHDEAAWTFLGDFLEWAASEPAVQWRALASLLPDASFQGPDAKPGRSPFFSTPTGPANPGRRAHSGHC